MIRTPREWTETCPTCKGEGKVHQKERFALWTPEEYPHRTPLSPRHNAPTDAYVCTTAPGALINDAVKEGIELAQKVSRPVVFTFNEVVIVCRADSNAEALIEDWDRRLRDPNRR